MTPLEIDILIWYYTRVEDYRQGDFSAPAVRDAIDAFTGPLGLLELKPRDLGDYRTYRLTDRGDVYVRALMTLPLPECQWMIPSPATVIAPPYRPDADTTERQPSPRDEQNPSASPKEVSRER